MSLHVGCFVAVMYMVYMVYMVCMARTVYMVYAAYTRLPGTNFSDDVFRQAQRAPICDAEAYCLLPRGAKRYYIFCAAADR